MIKGTINQHVNWWLCDSIFKRILDPNDFVYVATQLLPRSMRYDCGNMMSYLPLYDANGTKT